MFINNTDIELVAELADDQYDAMIERFKALREELSGYIPVVASINAAKLPVDYVDKDDLASLCEVYAWIASYRWNGSVPLANWAKHVITSRMQLVLGSLYRNKRTPRIETADGFITTRPESLDAIPTDVTSDDDDPIEALIAEELYFAARTLLLRRDQRVALVILRLLVQPDLEILRLGEQGFSQRGGKEVKITSKCYAQRLGISKARVANARRQIREAFMEVRDA